MVSRHNRRLPEEGPVVPPSGSMLQRLILPMMRVGFVAVIVVGAGLLGASLWKEFIAIEALTLTTVHLHGGPRVHKEALLAAAQTGYGDPLLGLDLTRAAKAMTAHPWVRTATLRRQLPNRLHIDVQEHEPKALVMMDRGLWLVNTLGEPFKPFVSDDAVSLPVVTGIVGLQEDKEGALPPTEGAEPVSQGPAVDGQEGAELLLGTPKAQLCEALALIDEVHERFTPHLQVEQVHVDEDLGFTLFLRPTKSDVDGAQDPGVALRMMTVHLGPTPLHRVELVAATLGRLKEQHLLAHTIWANGQRAPNRVQVRPYGPL